MMKTFVRCTHFDVNCLENKYDFNVLEEKTEEMKKFISITLQQFGFPLLCIDESEIIKIPEEDVCTKEKIVKCIMESSNNLVIESNSKTRKM